MTHWLLNIDVGMIDWARAQFALTAIYHWLFVPLTLGLAVVMGIMETIYYRTGKVFWKDAAKFWQRLFGINFAMGVATGIILEFEFGTNWSNYSWFVGDIFGAPLAIGRNHSVFLGKYVRCCDVLRMEQSVAWFSFDINMVDWFGRNDFCMVDSSSECMDAESSWLYLQSRHHAQRDGVVSGRGILTVCRW